jgi:hypothetical protein
MSRAEERARAKATARKLAEREKRERAALASFVATPRPTLVARAVQRALGAPPIDDPVHGHRALTVQRIREGLGLEQQTPTPTDPDGQATDRNA